MTSCTLVRTISDTGPMNPRVIVTLASPSSRFVLEAYIRKRGISTSVENFVQFYKPSPFNIRGDPRSNTERRHARTRIIKSKKDLKIRQCQCCQGVGIRCEISPLSEKCIRCQQCGEKCDLTVSKEEIDRWIKSYERLQARQLELEQITRKAATKESLSVQTSLQALERRHNKIINLERQNISELEFEKALARITDNSASFNPFLIDALLALGNTVSKSSQASPGNGDS